LPHPVLALWSRLRPELSVARTMNPAYNEAASPPANGPVPMSDVAKRLEKADKYLQKGKVEDALEELLRANEDDPNNEPVAQKAADLCVTLNRNADATRLL